MAVKEVVYLKPTKTQAVRAYLYLPDLLPDDPDGTEGTLLLYRAEEGKRETEDRYRVQCERDRHGVLASVLLHKTDTDEFREVTLAGPVAVCSCDGFRRWGYCAHRDAVVDLANSGRLSPEEPADEYDWREREEEDWNTIYQCEEC